MRYLKLLIILLIIPCVTNALELDMTKKGTLNILYKYGETLVSDTNVYLYRVAEYDKAGIPTYANGYNLNNNLNISTTNEAILLAEILNDYITENNIEFVKNCVTNDEGNCKFDDLELGVYLLKSSSKTNLEKQYYATPSLISIPFEDDITKEIKYDVNLILKTEVRDVTCPECNQKHEIKTKVINGIIDPEQIVEHEKDITINYRGYDGYKLKSIKVDGEEVDIKRYSSSFTFNKVIKDHEIEVIYEKEEIVKPVEITPTLDDIFTYVFLFGCSFIFITIIMYSIIKLRKIKNNNEGESSNEKDK